MKLILLLVFIFSVRDAHAQENLLDGFNVDYNGLYSDLSQTLFTDCTAIKILLGVSYTQMKSTYPPDTSRVAIEVRTASRMERFSLTNGANDILSSPLFDINLPVVIYIHGFAENTYSLSVQSITSALIKKGGFNVLFVDASSLLGFFFVTSSTNVQFIGEALGKQLAILDKNGVSNIHLIGFSYGSHISGFAGQTFIQLTGKRIARISGLDPAGPCFFVADANSSLSPGDAEFVDVMHTDAGVAGIIKPLGDVDFYPHGGSAQPNAPFIPQSHMRAIYLYVESLFNPTAFVAVKCDNWNTFLEGTCSGNKKTIMGYDTPTTARGIFSLRTNGVSPFGLGNAGSEPIIFDLKMFYKKYIFT